MNTIWLLSIVYIHCIYVHTCIFVHGLIKRIVLQSLYCSYKYIWIEIYLSWIQGSLHLEINMKVFINAGSVVLVFITSRFQARGRIINYSFQRYPEVFPVIPYNVFITVSYLRVGVLSIGVGESTVVKPTCRFHDGGTVTAVPVIVLVPLVNFPLLL